MKCHNVREELVAYIDDELSPMGRHAIEAHLAECADCAVECETLQETIEATHQIASIQPSQGWWEKLQENIQTPESDFLSELRALRESVARLESRMDGRLSQLEPAKEVMTLEEVASYLQIELDAMWNLFDEIPHFQVGYELRFRKSSVDEWMHMKENGSGSDSFHWDFPTNWLDRLSQLEP